MPQFRRLLNLLTALSLLLCVAVAVLWVRSYWVVDTVFWGRYDATQRRAVSVHAELVRGTLSCGYVDGTEQASADPLPQPNPPAKRVWLARAVEGWPYTTGPGFNSSRPWNSAATTSAPRPAGARSADTAPSHELLPPPRAATESTGIGRMGGVPAYVTHTLFAHLCLQALAETRHPLCGAALRHAGLFRTAGIAGCDIQCMPYQVCRSCDAPYRHDQGNSRRCLVCGREALEDFSFDAGGRRMGRRDVERELYGNTHLVLYRQYRGYGVPPELNKPGPAGQPLPGHAVTHLTNTLRDARTLAGKDGQVGRYLAFTLGWFAHVVSDALFKGLYPHAAKVNFFGMQYAVSMLPAAETLTMTDIARDFGVDWGAWHRELLRDEPDGGALRHLAMGDPPQAYGPHWDAAHGRPDPAIGRVIDAVRPLNRVWFHRMYVQPDYSAATPRLDRAPPAAADQRFGPKRLDLGEVRRHAIGSGWYDTFIAGVQIYLRAISEASEAAGGDAIGAGAAAGDGADARRPASEQAVGWTLWRDVITEATARGGRLADEWGSRIEVPQEAAAALTALRGRAASIVLPRTTNEHQRLLAEHLTKRLAFRHEEAAAPARIVVGAPAYNAEAGALLCHEDALRLKYDEGLAGLARFDRGTNSMLLAGFSEFGDRKLAEWIERTAGG